MATQETIKFSGTIPEQKEVVDEKSGDVTTPYKAAEKFAGEVVFNMPDSVEEAVQMWGAEVVLNKAQQAVIIDIQRIARSAEGDIEKAQENVNKFVPGVTRRDTGGPSMKALMEALKALPKEQRDALLAQAGVQL